MLFEWDPEKDRINRAKHGVAFEDAVLVWDDPLMVLSQDPYAADEPRWVALGRVGVTTIPFVVHVYRDQDDEQVVRIVSSARKATRHERRKYDQDLFQR